MKEFEAAKVLLRSGYRQDAQKIIQYLWEHPDRAKDQELAVFGALMEFWCDENPQSAVAFLEKIADASGEMNAFWSRRNLQEKALVHDWIGQISFALSDYQKAKENFGMAAALGRDEAMLCYHLGYLFIGDGELELGLRYIVRSLQLDRQPSLDVGDSLGPALGAFTGKHPVGLKLDEGAYLKLLYEVTKLAKGKRNLKSVRELVVELIHFYPREHRFKKIRLLLEKSLITYEIAEASQSLY